MYVYNNNKYMSVRARNNNMCTHNVCDGCVGTYIYQMGSRVVRRSNNETYLSIVMV